MYPESLVYAVLALAVLSVATASAITLTTVGRNPARMAVALRLAKAAFVCATALAVLLGAFDAS